MKNAMSENERLIKNTFLLSIGGLTPKFIGLITLPIATNNLTTGEYGIYDLILSVASILIPILTLQIQQGTFRYLLTAKTDDAKRAYISSTVVYLVITMLSASVISILGMHIAALSLRLAICICLMMCTEVGYIVFGQLLRGMEQNTKYTIGIIVYSVTYMIWMLILVAWMKLTLIGVILSVTLGYLTSFFYMLLQKEIKNFFSIHAFSLTHLKEILSFSAPIVPSSVSLWIVNMSDRLIVTAFLGVGMNGIYSAANKIPALYSTAYSIFNMAWTESAVRSYEKEDPARYYSRMFKSMFSFLVGIILLMLAATPIMFSILFDPKYDAAYYQMPVLYFGVFFSSIVSYYGSIYIAVKKTKHVAYSSTAGAFINLLVNLLLVKWIGLYAASFSTVISYLVICLYRYYDIKKLIKMQYKYKEILGGIVTLVVAATCCFTRNYIGYILCAVIAIIYNLVMNRKLAITFLELIKSKLRRG